VILSFGKVEKLKTISLKTVSISSLYYKPYVKEMMQLSLRKLGTT